MVLLKRFFLRSFFVGCLFYLFSVAVVLILRQAWPMLIEETFYVDKAMSAAVVLAFLVGVKLVLVFLMLVPALALHWLIRTQEKKNGTRA